MEGEEATTGINVEETVYGKKGEVLTVRKYNTLDSASVLCEEEFTMITAILPVYGSPALLFFGRP